MRGAEITQTLKKRRFIPLMVSRVVLSLKKAADSRVHRDSWTVENLTAVETGEPLSVLHHETKFRKRAAFLVNERFSKRSHQTKTVTGRALLLI